LTVRPSIVSRPHEAGEADPKERPGDGLSLSAPGSCHACASWTDSPMTLDLDNGVVVFPVTFQGGIGDVYELASGFKSCCANAGAGVPGSRSQNSDNKLKAFVVATYEVRPMEWNKGWNVRGGLAFSHIYDPSPIAMPATRPGTKAPFPCAGSLRCIARSRRRRNRQRRASPALPKASCCAVTGARVRAARARRSRPRPAKAC
jgi:hypothetical protein